MSRAGKCVENAVACVLLGALLLASTVFAQSEPEAPAQPSSGAGGATTWPRKDPGRGGKPSRRVGVPFTGRRRDQAGWERVWAGAQETQ